MANSLWCMSHAYVTQCVIVVVVAELRLVSRPRLHNTRPVIIIMICCCGATHAVQSATVGMARLWATDDYAVDYCGFVVVVNVVVVCLCVALAIVVQPVVQFGVGCIESIMWFQWKPYIVYICADLTEYYVHENNVCNYFIIDQEMWGNCKYFFMQ